jgi:hypothetical protein
MNRWCIGSLSLAALCFGNACSFSAPSPVPPRNDPHHTAVGFFDMHVCHWPERPLFFKAVFSSTRFDELEEIRIFSPQNEPLAQFNLEQYRTVQRKGKPPKRVYLVDIPLPSPAHDGWYEARIRTRDGQLRIARDRVAIRRMPQAVEAVNPEPGSVQPAPPRELSWSPVRGARHYIVFIHDRWDGDRLIFESPQLTEPRLVLPAGLLQPGGVYQWRVNVRDRHEDVEYGDFNHGSLSPFYSLSVSDRH